MRLQLRTVLAAFVLISASTFSRGVDISTPAGLNPGDQFRLIFITSTYVNASSTNISTYNTFVSNDAAGYTYNNQNISWYAIGSTATVDARDNIGGFGTNVPVYLVTGTRVANSLGTGTNGLWSGQLLSPINRTVAGVLASGEVPFTGTGSDGKKVSGYELGNTTVGQGDVTIGYSTASDSSWTNLFYSYNNSNLPFYGISATLTAVAVPEPSTYALAAIATGVMAVIARRRKRLAA